MNQVYIEIVGARAGDDVIRSADWVIDLGPEGGSKGGAILFEGKPRDLIDCKDSLTALYIQ